MATFFSYSGFNIDTLDFSAALQGSHTTTTLDGSSLPLDLPAIGIGSTDYQLPAHTFIFESAIRVTVSDTANGEVLGGDGFAFDAFGELIGGTATVLATLTEGHLEMAVAGFAISAVALGNAAKSVTTVDDRNLFHSIFAGNDLIVTSAFNDTFDGGAGKDLICDLGGNDVLSGGDGTDLIIAGKGADRMNGDAGNDLILGGAGNDRIRGGTGADNIWAGTGSDTVAGGSGRDVFLFKSGDGADHIADFTAADDQIRFIGPAFGLGNLHMRQVGADLKITFADVTVILDNTLRSSVTLADFDIGGSGAVQDAAHRFFDGWDYA